MISRLRGLLRAIDRESCEVDVGGVSYHVLLPPSVAERLAERPLGSEVELYTYYYLQTDPQKAIPVLLGFENRRQRDFFELLTQVPKFGPRAALRAMALPVATLARAIEAQDLRLLRSLPGVGPQRAKDLVAALEGKVAGFVQVVEGEAAVPLEPASEAEADAVDVLEQLGVPRADALRRVAAVRRDHPQVETADEIVRLAFRLG
ncbi:MAG: helix-hairpin-helix domain-containing protein [Armatimonadetes bacterium]|nr:helix-hairpin-helix domain-containing protein [Armatimonadota bacterium]